MEQEPQKEFEAKSFLFGSNNYVIVHNNSGKQGFIEAFEKCFK